MVIVPASSHRPMLAMDGSTLRPRVLIVDRQPLFLAAFKGLLEREPIGAYVQTMADSEAARVELGQNRYDIVFCDVRVKPHPWTEIGRVIQERREGTQLVLLADPDDERLLLEALPFGVAGLFTKDARVEELLAGVDAVLAGHRAVGAHLMRGILKRLESGSGGDSRAASSLLSVTELEILKMLAQASSVAQIAAARSITAKTVRNHIASIYRKLHLRTRTEAMLWAVRMGIAGLGAAEGPSPSPSRDI